MNCETCKSKVSVYIGLRKTKLNKNKKQYLYKKVGNFFQEHYYISWKNCRPFLRKYSFEISAIH